jgi:hypothetical protein
MPSLLASLLTTCCPGVVEPTGAGKTGIISLAPFAALGPLAAPGSACKVLVVTPNLGELCATVTTAVCAVLQQSVGAHAWHFRCLCSIE